MSFTFLSGDSFEVAHVCCTKWSAVECQVIDTRSFSAALIILDEDDQVLDVLELHEAKQYRISVQVSRL